MTEQHTQIEVPDLQDGEPPASAEQLQVIRQLVEGLSMQGFRFDYRKLGTDQAKSVVDQLLAMRGSSPPPPTKPKGPGCVARLVSGTVNLITLVLVVALVAGGVYYVAVINPDFISGLIGSEDEQADEDQPEGTAPADGDADTEQQDDPELVDSLLFDGLKVRKSPGTTDTPEPTPAGTDPDTPATSTPSATPPPAPDPTPTIDRTALGQLSDIDLLLVRLSQFTRDDYPQDIRATSVQGLTRKLATFEQGLTLIKDKDAPLADRINAIIQTYGEPTIDGQSMRDEIDAIRKQLDALR